MKTKLFNNLLLKILSVVGAIVLWLVVVNIDDAVDSRPLRNIKVNMVNMDAITSQGQMCRIEEGTDVVDLTVYARRSVLNSLKASDFVVTADMQKDLQFGSMVRIEVEYIGDSTIERVAQNRENVLVSIEESVTEQFKVTVRTKGDPDKEKGLVPGSAVPEQSLIEITGPASVVDRIKSVVVEVNITGITGTMVRSGKLKLLDSEGKPIDGTYLEYYGKDQDFHVTVTTLNTKKVGISFDTSLAAPENCSLGAISYLPETVTIAGTNSQIKPIYNLEIPAEALNPEGAIGKIEQRVDISQYLSDGLLIPDEEEREIVVTMEIIPHVSKNFLFQGDQIRWENLQPGLAPDWSESGMREVVVSGVESELAELTPDAVILSADLSEYQKPGTYQVPVALVVPEGIQAPEGLEMTLTLAKAEE